MYEKGVDNVILLQGGLRGLLVSQEEKEREREREREILLLCAAKSRMNTAIC